jgi:hypothetical protein
LNAKHPTRNSGQNWALYGSGLYLGGEFLYLGFYGNNELDGYGLSLKAGAYELLVTPCKVELFEAAGVLLYLQQKLLLLLQGKFSIHGLHHPAIEFNTSVFGEGTFTILVHNAVLVIRSLAF